MTDQIENLMHHALEDGVFPAAQLLVASKGEVLHHKAYGNATTDTVFDIASLTKPVSTTSIIMKMVERDGLRLNDPILPILPECTNFGKEMITIRHLLSHSSGLPAWEPYYQMVPKEDVGRPSGKQLVLDFVCREELTYKTGYQSVYSDLGFILLGEIAERLAKKDLIKLFNETVARPLKLQNTFFAPIGSSNSLKEKFSFAPTEDCPWRKKVLKGEVHDQNCYTMGGVAGHAGLFSNTADLHIFISDLVAKYKDGNETVGRFLPFRDQLTECNSTWLLGWDRPSHVNSQAGNHFSTESIGHLGYTGCSMWIDLKKDYWIVLLSNRVNPTSANEKIRSFRPTLYNFICERLLSDEYKNE